VEAQQWENPVVTPDSALYHCDCRKGLDELPANSVHLCATDGPYFIDGMGDGWDHQKLKARAAKAGIVKGMPVRMGFDPQQGKDLQEFYLVVAQKVRTVLVPGAFFLAFMQPRLSYRLAAAVEEAGFEIRDLLSWQHNGGQGKAFTMNHFVERRKDLSRKEKDAIIASMDGRKTPQLRPVFESILVALKPLEGAFWQNWQKWGTGLIKTDFGSAQQQTSIFSYKKDKSRATVDHLTIKPVPLMEQLLRVYSTEGQTVLDPFTGSAATGIAAINTHRRFIGMEKNREYFRLAARRMAEARQELEKSGTAPQPQAMG